MISLMVPYIGPSTNVIYAGVHYGTRMKHKKIGVQAMEYAIRDTLGLQREWPTITYPIGLTFTPHHAGQTYDLDGYGYAAKILTDAMVKVGLLKNDSQKYVRLLTIKPTVKSDERSMLVEIVSL